METKRDPMTLHSRAAITLATFLGSPIAGCLLLTSNYRKLGNSPAARQCLGWGVLCTLVVIGFPVLLPYWITAFALTAICTYTMYNVATMLQWRAYNAHVKRGGATASLWHAVLVGLICMVILIAVILAVDLALGYPQPWWYRLLY